MVDIAGSWWLERTRTKAGQMKRVIPPCMLVSHAGASGADKDSKDRAPAGRREGKGTLHPWLGSLL